MDIGKGLGLGVPGTPIGGRTYVVVLYMGRDIFYRNIGRSWADFGMRV